MRRVVLDTNVVVSSLFGGKPKDVLDMWQARRFILCVSDAILSEYLRVIERFRVSGRQVGRLLAMLDEGA